MIHLFARLLAGDGGTIIRHARRNAILYVLAAICVLSAFAAGVTALGLFLSTLFDPVAAALLVAAIMVVLALVLAGVALVLKRMERRRAASKQVVAATAALSLAPYLLRQRSPLILAAAAGLGIVAAGWLKDRSAPED